MCSEETLIVIAIFMHFSNIKQSWIMIKKFDCLNMPVGKFKGVASNILSRVCPKTLYYHQCAVINFL